MSGTDRDGPLAVNEASANYLSKAQRVKPGYKQTEVGVVPEDWHLDCVENLAYITTGSRNTQDRVDDGLYPFFVRSQTVERINSYSFDGEAVLTAGDGVGTGKVFHYINGKFDAHQRVYRISNFREDINGYFFYLYFSSHFYNRIMQMTAKSSVDSVRREMIAKMFIPYPPTKAEQQAIAEALGDADALVEALEQLIAKKRQIKQGAMQELLTGKRRLPGFSGEWEVKRLGEVAQLKNGYAFQSSSYTDIGRYKVVTIANVQDGFMIVDECSKIAVLPQDVQPHQRLCYNDILISMTGNVGRVCRVNHDDCLLNQRVGKLVPIGIDDRFLFAALCQRKFLIAMGLKAKGGAQGNLAKSDITEFELSIPSDIEEQTAIASTLTDMDAEIAALEEKLAKARQIKQGMMQELLTGRIRLV